MPERFIFGNSEKVFLEKKAAFIEVAQVSQHIKALHEKIKLLPDGAEKAGIVNQLLAEEKKRLELYSYIDASVS